MTGDQAPMSSNAGDVIPESRGAVDGLWVVLAKLLRRFVYVSRVLVREPVAGSLREIEEEGFVLRQASPDDLDRGVNDLPGELDSAFVEAALVRNDICIAAFHGGRMIAFAWRSFGVAPHIKGVRVRVDQPYWYTYKMFAHPDFRGQRLSGALTLLGDVVAADRGRHVGVGFIDMRNEASLRANLRLGSKIVGYAGFLRAGSLLIPFHTPGVVARTFRFERDND